MNKSLIDRIIILNGWVVKGDKLYRVFSHFAVNVSMKFIDNNDFIMDNSENRVNYLLTIHSLSGMKIMELLFSSLQEVIFFTNYYLPLSTCFSDIESFYTAYQLSDDVVKRKEYIS